MSDDFADKKFCRLRNIDVKIVRLFSPGQLSDSGAIHIKCMNKLKGVCDKLNCKFATDGDAEPFEE